MSFQHKLGAYCINNEIALHSPYKTHVKCMVWHVPTSAAAAAAAATLKGLAGLGLGAFLAGLGLGAFRLRSTTGF